MKRKLNLLKTILFLELTLHTLTTVEVSRFTKKSPFLKSKSLSWLNWCRKDHLGHRTGRNLASCCRPL